MFNPRPRQNWYPLDRLEEFYESIVWPVSVSRPPTSVTSALSLIPRQLDHLSQISRKASSATADQWRQQIGILFIALFVAWEENGEIPDINAPPSAANAKNTSAQAKMEKMLQKRLMQCLLVTNPHPSDEEIDCIKAMKMRQSLCEHYAAVLQFTVAIQLLASSS